MANVLDDVREYLSSQGVEFREVQHEPTKTSEESATARGEPLRVGGKALLMKGDGQFLLFVLPADCKVDSGVIREQLKIRKLRFANRDELLELTSGPDREGLVPGSVPPFGHPILPFDLFVDEAVRENDRIAFNAGSLTDSIVMPIDCYFAVARPREVFAFSVRA